MQSLLGILVLMVLVQSIAKFQVFQNYPGYVQVKIECEHNRCIWPWPVHYSSLYSKLKDVTRNLLIIRRHVDCGEDSVTI